MEQTPVSTLLIKSPFDFSIESGIGKDGTEFVGLVRIVMESQDNKQMGFQLDARDAHNLAIRLLEVSLRTMTQAGWILKLQEKFPGLTEEEAIRAIRT